MSDINFETGTYSLVIVTILIKGPQCADIQISLADEVYRTELQYLNLRHVYCRTNDLQYLRVGVT